MILQVIVQVDVCDIGDYWSFSDLKTVTCSRTEKDLSQTVVSFSEPSVNQALDLQSIKFWIAK